MTFGIDFDALTLKERLSFSISSQTQKQYYDFVSSKVTILAFNPFDMPKETKINTFFMKEI